MMEHFVPLCFAAILGCLMTTNAETVKDDSAQKFIEVFWTSSGGVVEKDIVLLGDLDFSESGLTYPLGVDSNGDCGIQWKVSRQWKLNQGSCHGQFK